MPSASVPRFPDRALAAARPGGLGWRPAEQLLEAFGWLLGRSCPLCRQVPPRGADRQACASPGGLCQACRQRLALPQGGLSGRAPLIWWSSGAYGGALRQTLLNQRRHPNPVVIRALLEPLQQQLHASLRERRKPRPGQEPLLVPVPSWKRNPNPLPGLIADGLAQGLALRRLDLLARSHPVLGQHRLNRRLRHENQRGSFQLNPSHHWRQPRPVLLVDDILTTGSTLRHAALCLSEAGWPVLGAACLARTPGRGDWLRTP